MGARVTVLGGSGYAGGEVLRLVRAHPAVTVVAVAANHHAGREISEVQPHLIGEQTSFGSSPEVAAAEADACVSCLPSGALAGLLGDIAAPVVIDLSDEHRRHDGWVYGLCEFNRAFLGGPRIAVPGCYPTATLLALVPFARAGVIGSPVIVDAMSGVSGAGRSPEDRLLFAHIDGDVGAYGSVEHRHVPEIERGLVELGGVEAGVSFTPHLVPLARGLLVTARAPLTRPLTDEEALSILTSTYSREPFVDVVAEWPSPKRVAGTNRALLSARVDARNSLLIASAAIDNLGKGAAGQAVQNLNLCLGLDETTGLEGVAAWP